MCVRVWVCLFIRSPLLQFSFKLVPLLLALLRWRLLLPLLRLLLPRRLWLLLNNCRQFTRNFRERIKLFSKKPSELFQAAPLLGSSKLQRARRYTISNISSMQMKPSRYLSSIGLVLCHEILLGANDLKGWKKIPFFASPKTINWKVDGHFCNWSRICCDLRQNWPGNSCSWKK